eukprot:jgi/Mesvir1/15227/Mv06454-RA.2
MLLLFETPAGFALFKVLKEGVLDKAEDLYNDFQSLESAQKVVKLKAFSKFANTTEALTEATALVDSKLSKGLRKFLQKHGGDPAEPLAVADSKLGNLIKEKIGMPCVHGAAVTELMRGVRLQLGELVSGLAGHDMAPMALGLSHSLSRYKLKFSPDKVDTMIVQAIGLLDDIDKELNTYSMRVREWYGWHFPEAGKIVTDNLQYAKMVKFMGVRTNAADADFSGILDEDVESDLKEAAIVSMGTEISADDMDNIIALCHQVIELGNYRAQLYDYLKSRMTAIAPNLTVLVGELVGARLIAHAGSLMNLAKHPGSTVQILGAEKALFRALKTKHETPKYGLIYHASLIGQAAPKLKGKISRILASKCALSCRVDALGDTTEATIGLENRAKVEARLRALEGRGAGQASATPKGKPKFDKYEKGRSPGGLITATKAYNPAADVVLNGDAGGAAERADDAAKKEKKKKKKQAEEAAAEGARAAEAEDVSKQASNHSVFCTAVCEDAGNHERRELGRGSRGGLLTRFKNANAHKVVRGGRSRR